jgi:hypothetical protein
MPLIERSTMADSQQVQGRRADAQPPHVAPDHDHHGRSVAAWTAVGIMMFGALIMSIAVVITTVWVFVLGAVVVVIGAIAGRLLSAMGFGVSGRPGH